MGKPASRLQRFREGVQALLEGRTLHVERPSKLHRFVHFWALVGTSFSRNRGPARAAALAYSTLLALIPMLAVVVSVTSTFLKKEGEEQIDQFIVKFVASVTPPGVISTNTLSTATNPAPQAHATANFPATNATMTSEGANGPVPPVVTQNDQGGTARRAIAREIFQYIQSTRSGALGVTGSVLLIFAAISMLSGVESTFNDIWGVARGRSWFMRIVLYWGVLSLAPLLIVVALGLATGPHLETTKRLIENMPLIGNFLFQFGFQCLPVVLLCLSLSVFYMLMPNARVNWRAALAGGLLGGLLFHLNNLLSVFYVSRVVSNSKIYGGLGLVPVFMIGLYFCWLILLFGAQVAYAYQNRASYLEEKQVENVNQRGREFIALRLMTCIGQRFQQGLPPPTVAEASQQLSVPTRLIYQLLQTLCAARLVVETSGADPAFLPARPLEMINCHDILLALRASQGQELATSDEPARVEVYGEFQRIQEAERLAASSVTVSAMVARSQKQNQIAG